MLAGEAVNQPWGWKACLTLTGELEGRRGATFSLIKCRSIPPVLTSLVPETSYDKHIWRLAALGIAAF